MVVFWFENVPRDLAHHGYFASRQTFYIILFTIFSISPSIIIIIITVVVIIAISAFNFFALHGLVIVGRLVSFAGPDGWFRNAIDHMRQTGQLYYNVD